MFKQLEFVPLANYHESIVAKIEIIQDQCPSSPREWSNLGEIVVRKALDRHLSGDRLVDDEEMSELINRCRTKAIAWVPVYAYIHSGVWLATSNTNYPFDYEWDPSFAGVIYADTEAIIEEYGDLSVGSYNKAIACLESEVKIYRQYLTGDTYGYRMLDSDGEEVDSCWGFYGSDPFDNGMSDAIDSKYHDLLKQAAENIKYG